MEQGIVEQRSLFAIEPGKNNLSGGASAALAAAMNSSTKHSTHNMDLEFFYSFVVSD
jgi:hypothetical protein